MPDPITSILSWGDRHLPATTIMDQARAYEASGVIDDLTLPDHLSNFLAPSLWTAENTPMAQLLGDVDSLHDAYIMGALAHTAAPNLSLSFATDAIRRGPAEMSQTMLSMASLMEGRARFLFGAGELKQCRSFGHKRGQGLARQEDLLRFFDALWNSDGPVSLAGNHWEMRNAFLGSAKPYRPELWVMGTGPKQIEIAAPYVDGVCSVAPSAWRTPGEASSRIETIRERFEAGGRDPGVIKFGAVVSLLTHEDTEVLDRMLDNPIARWVAAIVGRINPEDWREDGIEPATPEGWTYYMKYAPYLTDPGFVDEVVAKTSRKMAERSFIHGTPQEVAATLREYADAGVSFFCLGDFTSIMLAPEDAANQAARVIEMCAALKNGT
jgi:phthiodiolone/phenolphthiodiolone dimycocerosates ketoreductase